MSEETPLPSVDDASAETQASPSAPPAWESNGSGGSTGEGSAATDEPATNPDEGAVFLASLASAMKEAATAERTRVVEDIDRRRDAHLEGIEARRESEGGRIHQLADDDRAAVQAWVETEEKRIGAERDRRIAAVEADLQGSLAEHGAKIDAEKERVEAAIATYRTEVDAYFEKLGGETDPVAIAQQAGQRPVFPDLDAIGAEEPPTIPEAATQLADQGTRMIGVMASSRPTTKLSQAWAAWNASGGTDGSAPTPPTETAVDTVASAETAPPEPHINPVDPGPDPEPVAVAAGAMESPADPVPAAPSAASAPEASPDPAPQSSSSFGGMSWLRRDKGNDQKS
jgi:hypothetical protein